MPKSAQKKLEPIVLNTSCDQDISVEVQRRAVILPCNVNGAGEEIGRGVEVNDAH